MAIGIDIGIDHLADVEEIGRGGFSVVYSAQHTLFRRAVAVKVLHKLAREADRRRFERECEVMARLSGHPNVVTVHHAGYARDDRPYLIMELITGGSLAASLSRRQRFPWPEAVGLMLPVCEAVGQAHSEQILHRDIKPENILLDTQVPKLTDFGIAYLRDATGASSTHVTASLLHTPPETFENRRDERSDLYSLASTLYTLVAGNPPFWHPGDESLSPLMFRLVTQPPPPLSGDVPAELDGLLQSCLAKNPDHRPQTAAELGRALAALIPATTGTRAASAPATTLVPPAPHVLPTQSARAQPHRTMAASPALSAAPDRPAGAGSRPPQGPMVTRLAWLALIVAALSALANWDLYLDEAHWSSRMGVSLTAGFILWFALPIVALAAAALAVLMARSRGPGAASLLVGVILGALYYSYAARIGLRGLLIGRTNHYSLLGWVDWLAVLASFTALALWSAESRFGAQPGSRGAIRLLAGSAAIILLGGLTTVLTDSPAISDLSIDLTGLSLLFAGLLALAAIGYRSPLVGAVGATAAALSLGVSEWQLSLLVLGEQRDNGLGVGINVQAVGFAVFALACAYLASRSQGSSAEQPSRAST